MHLNLRQMEKICAHIRLTLDTFNQNQTVNPSIILMLMYFRIVDGNFYDQIVNKSITAQELLTHIEDTLPRKLFIENEYVSEVLTVAIAQLIISYNFNKEGTQHEKLIVKQKSDDDSKETIRLSISSKVVSNDSLLEAMNIYYYPTFGSHRILPLGYIIQHIELLKSFQSL